MPACKACGTQNRASHRFCSNCGRQLVLGAEHAPAPTALRAVANELKVVTVLFADLCDSTELVSGADPEEAQRRLSVAITAMSESVEEYGGTISQLLGDGLLALFGAPVAQEDHPLRACLAAIAVQQRIRTMTIARPLQVRIGIHSGEVIVGTASQYLSSHYRADGTTIHIASRVEKLAQPGTAWITRETFRLVESAIEARCEGEYEIRGDSIPERKLYSLVTTGPRSAAAPLARRAMLGPLIGREQALAKLRVHMDACLQRSFRLVGLRGEAGVGKSRLLATFRDELRSRGFRDFAVAPRAYASHVAYNLASELARALIGLGPHAAASRVDAELTSWPLPSVEHQRAINDLLGRNQQDAQWSDLSPPQRQRHLVDAVKWLIERQLERGPVAILIEDLHQADNASLRLLDKVIPRLKDRCALVLVSSRNELAERWYGQPWFAEQWLDPLEEADMRRLATALLGSHDSVAPLVDFVVQRADGNPFFLEQLVITLIDNVSLVGAPGDYRCIRSCSELAIPVSIAAVISARVDALPPACKAALEAAAVLGEPISIHTVAAMQQLDPADAKRHLALAVGAGLLRPQEATREAFYEFRHALVREVVCAALTQSRRKGLHRAAFIALHGQDAGGDTELAPLLARHAFAGELWLEAAGFALKGMARSIARSANRDALLMLELGLDAVSHQEHGDAALQRTELALRMKAIGALLPLGQSASIVDNLERATAIAKRLADPRSEAAASLQLAVTQWTRGEYASGLVAAETAALSAAATGNRNLQLAALQARVLLHHGQGRYREALADVHQAHAEYALELSQPQMLPGWVVLAECNMLVFMADCLWRMGDFDAAQEALDRSYGVLAQNEHAFTRSVNDFVQGELWVARGRAADAAELLERTLALCVSSDIPTMYPPVLAAHAFALARSGRAAAAYEALSRANEQKVWRSGGRYNEYYFPRVLGICLVELGRHEEALVQARAAASAATASGQHGHVVDAMHLEGECLAALGRHDAALSCLLDAAARADACAMHLTAKQVRALIDRIAPERAGTAGATGSEQAVAERAV
jgi:class 3 adenylate cyclase/tetratricopeptide (TPR) repeat protein